MGRCAHDLGGGPVSAGRKGYVARSMRSLAPYTDTYVCISEYVRNLMKEYSLPEEKLQKILCATNVKVDRDYPSGLREELSLPQDIPVVGSTGVWRPNKGFTYFLAACEMVRAKNPTAHFLLGGKAYSPDFAFSISIWVRGQFLRMLHALDFTGFQEDVGHFLSALDIFVLPSDCEPFGLIAIEAMARGIPVVATNAGGVPELIKHGETGLLVPPQNPDAIAAAVNFLLSDPMRRMQIGESGRLNVRKLFDKTRMLKEYEALYERVAQKKL
jgi:glycosyltransferase involved in cell wall biosynthesis